MKIDLSQATFIIPIRIESDDRLRNVITSVCFLISNFNTNIIIHEVDSSSVFSERALPQIQEFCGDTPRLRHIFEQSNSPAFHRQRVLNDMLMETTTKVVVNYDCDIILPLNAYQNAYCQILNDEADLVYPYGDGEYQIQVFADDNIVTQFLVNDFNFEFLLKKAKKYDAKYGFCQFFNRDVYIEGGMENENFVAYAPEDVERYFRFKTLGYRVNRICSMVYHLEHVRSHNSSFSNPHMKCNNEEWKKIQSMDADTLRKYILNQDYYKRRTNG